MRFFFHVILASLMLAIPAGTGAVDYDILARKADRFYADREWAGALAMYELMLAERPTVVSTYGNAIVAAGVAGQSAVGISLLDRAMRNRVSLDSIFSAVETRSYALGRPAVYEDFLLLVKERQPWMKRNIDARLLDYYTFRRNPDKMVEMARLMLDGLPDSIDFLTLLARGLMMRGDTDESLATYTRILSLDPHNYNALLQLGNCYLLRYRANPGDTAARDSAIRYLSEAAALHPTPYVDGALSALTGATDRRD